MSIKYYLHVNVMIWCVLKLITLNLSLNINQQLVSLVLWMFRNFFLIWYSNCHNHILLFFQAYERSWRYVYHNSCFLYVWNYEMYSNDSSWDVFIFMEAIDSVIKLLIGCCAKKGGGASNVKSNGKFGNSTSSSIHFIFKWVKIMFYTHGSLSSILFSQEYRHWKNFWCWLLKANTWIYEFVHGFPRNL